MSETSGKTEPGHPVSLPPTEAPVAPLAMPVQQPTQQTFGGYLIEGQLGRGGMGIVYKAIDQKLRRTVALKMILRGEHAGPEDMARFLSEAQAAAGLQHPNIVQVYEVGQQNGLPYFTLEYVAGGSLAARLAGQPQPPSDSARLVETLARAVEYAHQHGIIHRDLKPANVLLSFSGSPLASAGRDTNLSRPALARGEPLNGVPKITDFGLAKRIGGDAGMTQSGAIVGTPSYMAPEQAAGKTKSLDARVDVYALGAILYELLTGRPPFRAPTSAETILQVLADEPVPVRQLQPNTPADLETICNKCLQKDPSRRYGSAAALGEDLRRFQANEPILARPVGGVERAWRWCRRYPAIASLLVVLVLATGIVSALTVFAFRKAHEAGESAAREAAAKEDAVAKQKALLLKVAEATYSPLGLHGDRALVDPEIKSLWEAATWPDDDFWRPFVKQGVSENLRIRQLRFRAAYVFQAAVGLDSRRRAEVEKLLMAKWDEDLKSDVRIDLGMAVSALGDLNQTFAARVAVAFAEVESESATRVSLSGPLPALTGLRALVPQLAPREAARVLSQTMSATKNPIALHDLAPLLATAAGRLEPGEAAELCRQPFLSMTWHVSSTTSSDFQYGLAMAMPPLAAFIDPKDGVPILIEAVKKARNAQVLYQLTRSLGPLVDRMQPEEAQQAVLALIQALKSTRTLGTFSETPQLMMNLVSRMNPKEAIRLLAEEVKTASDAKDLGRLAAAVRILQVHGEEKEAHVLRSQTARKLIQVMSKTTDMPALADLGTALGQVARSLPPEEAVTFAEQTADILFQAMSKTTEANSLTRLQNALIYVVQQFRGQDTARAALLLSQAAGKMSNPGSASYLADTLRKFVPRLNAGDAARLLVQTMRQTKGAMPLARLAQGLDVALASLDPGDAGPPCREAVVLLMQTMSGTKEASTRDWVKGVLIALCARLEPNEATRLATEAIDKTTDSLALASLSSTLAGLAQRLEVKEREKVCRELVQRLKGTLGKTTDAVAVFQLTSAMADAALGLESKEALSLLNEMRDSERLVASRELSASLAAVALRLDPMEAANFLTQALRHKPSSYNSVPLGKSLAEVAERLPRKEAATVCGEGVRVFLELLEKATGQYEIGNLTTALMPLAAHMDAKESAIVYNQIALAVLRSLSPIMSMYTEIRARTLSTVAPRMAPQQVSRIVDSLIELLGRATDDTSIRRLMKPLEAIAVHMDAADAHRAARALMLVISKASNIALARVLSRGLPAVLTGSPLLTRLEDPASLATAFGLGTDGRGPLLVVSSLNAALQPCSSRLSTQELVELLKHPLCVGPVRRAVLDVLEVQLGHMFKDQWDFVRFVEQKGLKLDLTTAPMIEK